MAAVCSGANRSTSLGWGDMLHQESILTTGTGWKPQGGGRSSPGPIFHPK